MEEEGEPKKGDQASASNEEDAASKKAKKKESKAKYILKLQALGDSSKDSVYPMPLAQAVATEDQLAVGKSFSGKTHALSVSASVNDRLLRRMYTTVSNPTEIQQKCVQKNCNASVHISLKVKTEKFTVSEYNAHTCTTAITSKTPKPNASKSKLRKTKTWPPHSLTAPMLAPVVASYVAGGKSLDTAAGIVALGTYMRETPTSQVVRKIINYAKDNRTGGDSAWSGVDKVYAYAGLLRQQGHYIHIDTSEADVMKQLRIQKAKQDHQIYARQMKKKNKDFEAFDPAAVPLGDIEDGKTYFTGFVFVPKWIIDLMRDGVLPDIITADAAHCDKGIMLAAHGHDANRTQLLLIGAWFFGAENYRAWSTFWSEGKKPFAIPSEENPNENTLDHVGKTIVSDQDKGMDKVITTQESDVDDSAKPLVNVQHFLCELGNLSCCVPWLPTSVHPSPH